MAANGNALAKPRTTIMKYVYPSAKLDWGMAYKTPPSYAPPTIFFLPFTLGVWQVIFVVLTVIVFCIALVMVLSPIWHHSDSPSISQHSTAFRLLTGTFFDEALTNPPGISAKIVFAALLIATSLSFILYTSVLTSFLSYQEVKLPINSVKDLVENRKYRPVFINTTLHFEMSRLAKSGLYAELWKKAMHHLEKGVVESYDKAVDNIINHPGTVTIADSNSMVGAIDFPCRYEPTVIRTKVVRDYFYFVSRLDLPYNTMIYKRYLRMSEEGIFERLRKYYGIRDKLQCHKENVSFSFTLKQAIAPFCFLIGGIIFALIAVLVEKCCYRTL